MTIARLANINITNIASVELFLRVGTFLCNSTVTADTQMKWFSLNRSLLNGQLVRAEVMASKHMFLDLQIVVFHIQMFL